MDINKEPMLEIHVLSAGYGESIIVGLPDGKWGVVDCYSRTPRDPKTHPVMRWLNERGVEQLEFLCLTHPHNDHYRGMSLLMDHFPPRQFWRFNSPNFVQILKEIYRKATEDNEATLGKSKEDANDLALTMAKAKQRRQSGNLTVKYVNSEKLLYQESVGVNKDVIVSIRGLAPSDNIAELYQDRFAAAVDAWQQGNDEVDLPHNLISGALRIEYGQASIVLGGDVESESWKYSLKELHASQFSADVVKVSHHGSSNGYCDGLWSAFSSINTPIAIITPAPKYNIPWPETLEHISQHAREVLLTIPYAKGCDTSSQEETQQIGVFNVKPRVSDKSFGSWSLAIESDGTVDCTAKGRACHMSDLSYSVL